MLRDWCTWDQDYNDLVQEIRHELLQLAGAGEDQYTVVPMQGSGTFAVEAAIGTALPASGKLLVLVNGAYGQRMATIARYLKIALEVYDTGDLARHEVEHLDRLLVNDPGITHVAVVHCETTTGMLNDIEAIGRIVKGRGRGYIVDAMSSLGGMPLDTTGLGIDYLISSANKCIQGVPGFGFVIARKTALEACAGNARSLSLDLHDQWRTMEQGRGKWRFTSPTHVVRAFRQAIAELHQEGGVPARHRRYAANQKRLVAGMRDLGIETLLPDALQSPFITTFISPTTNGFCFERFYKGMKSRGFVIYPGKVTDFECFRIGNIGEVYAQDIEALLKAVSLELNNSPATFE